MGDSTYTVIGPAPEVEPDHPLLGPQVGHIIEGLPTAVFAIEPLTALDDPHPDFRLIAANALHLGRTGLAAQVGLPFSAWAGPELIATLATNYRWAIHHAQQIRYDEFLQLPAGPAWWRTHLTPLFVGGRCARLIGSTAIFTAEREAHQALAEAHRALAKTTDALERLAGTDDLTELPNRRALLRQLAAAHAHFERSGAPYTLAILDIDRFKQINDSEGHAAGDATLQHLADGIRAQLRPSDMGARLGGDEFALLFPNTQLKGAQVAIRRLRAAYLGPNARGSTLSAGVAQARRGDTADQTLRRADHALYRAKANRIGQTISATGEHAGPLLSATVHTPRPAQPTTPDPSDPSE